MFVVVNEFSEGARRSEVSRRRQISTELRIDSLFISILKSLIVIRKLSC